MNCINRTKAVKRYNLRLFLASVIYLAVLLCVTYIHKHVPLAQPVAVLLSILPALPIVGMIVAIGLYLREETDEFQRHILVQALLWAMGLTLVATSVWGFLELFAAANPLPQFYVFIIFWIAFGLSTPVIRLQYRGAADE